MRWLTPLLLAVFSGTAAALAASSNRESLVATAAAAERTAPSVSTSIAAGGAEDQEPKPRVFGDVIVRVPMVESMQMTPAMSNALKSAVRAESSAKVGSDTEVPNVWLIVHDRATNALRVRFQVDFTLMQHRQSFIREFVVDGAQRVATAVCAGITRTARGICGLPELDSVTSGIEMEPFRNSFIPLAKLAALEAEQRVVRGGAHRTDLERHVSISAAAELGEGAAPQLPEVTVSGYITFNVSWAHGLPRSAEAQEAMAQAVAQTAQVRRDQIATMAASMTPDQVRVDFWVPSPHMAVRRAFIWRIFRTQNLIVNINRAVPAPWTGKCVLVASGATSAWWKH